MHLESLEFIVLGGLLKTARIRAEWTDDIEDPEAVIGELFRRKIAADIFTFWQRYPDTARRYPYHQEWDNWAVLPLTSFEDWFNHQVQRKARTAIRKAWKAGVEVRIVPLDDDYIAGVTRIFNELPIRQGRAYSHYGKSFEQVKEELSRAAVRTDFIGAYFRGEMIGFIQQVYVQDGAFPFGGVCSIAHRDKSPNSAMLAKSVEACAKRGGKFLVYGQYDYGAGGGGLTEFKARHGFQEVLVPRYFIPLTHRGRIGLGLRLHRGFKRLIPRRVMKPIAAFRRAWYTQRGKS